MDVDIVFSLLRVRDEGLNEELTENTSDSLNLDFLCGTSLNPFPSLSPGLVETKETALATALDQLVGFGDKFGAGSEEPRVGDLSLVKDILHSKVVGEVDGGESGRRVVGGGGRKRSRLDDGSTSEVVVEDGLSIGLENGLSRHCELLDVVKIIKSRGGYRGEQVRGRERRKEEVYATEVVEVGVEVEVEKTRRGMGRR